MADIIYHSISKSEIEESSNNPQMQIDFNIFSFSPTQRFAIFKGNKDRFCSMPVTIKFAISFTFKLYDLGLIIDLPKALSLLGFMQSGFWYCLLKEESMKTLPNKTISEGSKKIFAKTKWTDYEDFHLFSSLYNGHPKNSLRGDFAVQKRMSKWNSILKAHQIYSNYFHSCISFQEGLSNILDEDTTFEGGKPQNQISYQKKNWESIKQNKKIENERMEAMRKRKQEKKIEKKQMSQNMFFKENLLQYFYI